MPTARELMTQARKGQVGSLADKLIDGSTITTTNAAISNLNEACDKEAQRLLVVDNAGTAGVATNTKCVQFADKKQKIVSLHLIPNAATSSATVDYFTITVVHVNSTDNGGAVTVGTFHLSTTAMAACVPVAITVTPSLAEVSANRVIKVVHTKTSGGAAYDYRVQAIVQEI